MALMLAMAPVGGAALAEELAQLPAQSPSQAPELLLADDLGASAMDSESLADTSGGFAVQISDTDLNSTFTGNPVTVDNGGQINTGTIAASNANSGGITTTMLNTGNNVSFQASTTLNIYLDQ